MNGRKRARRSAGSAALTGVALLAIALAAGALVACGDEPPAAPSGDPSITGVVATATPAVGSDILTSFLIEGGTGDYDRASVSVTGGTDWYRRNAAGLEEIDAPLASELEDKKVEVQFTGPVAESYPVQATAGWVIVAE